MTCLDDTITTTAAAMAATTAATPSAFTAMTITDAVRVEAAAWAGSSTTATCASWFSS